MTLSIEARLERIEKAISDIQRTLGLEQLATPPSSPPVTPPTAVPEPISAVSAAVPASPAPVPSASSAPSYVTTAPGAAPPSATPPARPFWERYLNTEFIVSVLGIGLLLFGVAFLFKYAIDQGWITPAIRLAIGYLIGGTLLVFGVRIADKRAGYGQILNGGAIGAFYITTFAGYFILEITPYLLALVLMSVTTALAYGLAIWRRQQVFALIGLIGGLATPFVLSTGSGSMGGLLAYTAIIITAAVGIYFSLRWRPVLAVAAAGGWAIFLSAWALAPVAPSLNDTWALQLMAIFNFAAFALVPLVRTLLDLGSSTPSEMQTGATTAERSVPWYVHATAVSSPLVAFFVSSLLWDLSDLTWGVILSVLAAGYAVGGWLMDQKRPFQSLAYTHYLVAAALLAWALIYLLDGEVRTMALTLEAAALMVLSRRGDYLVLRVFAHVLYISLGAYLLLALWPEYRAFATPLANIQFLSQMIYLAVGVLIAHLETNEFLKNLYRLGAHAGAMGVIALEVAVTERPRQWIDIGFLLWVVLAGAVYEIGRRYELRLLSLQGIGAMVITALSVWVAESFNELAWANLFFAIGALQIGWVNFDSRIKENDLLLTGSGLTLAAVVTLWQIFRFGWHDSGSAFLSWPAFTGLLLVAVLVGSAKLSKIRWVQLTYGLTAHGLFLLWLYFESQNLAANGQGVTTILWAIYAVALLVWGLIERQQLLRNLGLATILLVIGKLFLVDLTEVETIFRILLFLGFGVLLLLVGYFSQALWKRREETSL